MISRSGDDNDVRFFNFEWLDLSDIPNNRLCSGLSRPALYCIRHSPRIAVITFVAYNDVHSFTLTSDHNALSSLNSFRASISTRWSVKQNNFYLLVLIVPFDVFRNDDESVCFSPVSYTHLRAHETDSYLVCRLL